MPSAKDLALIFGATGGLGPAIVEAFVNRGDQVIAVARSIAEVSALERQYPGQVMGDTADLTQRLSVDDVWERIDRLGVPRWVVNATGGFKGGKVADSAPDDFTSMIDLNLGSTWWSCRAAARRMRGGAIVNVSSRSGWEAEPGAAAYAVSKAAVITLTQVLAAELKGSEVRVNCVVPAIIDTPSNRRSLPEKLLQKAVPPAEIAAVISHLCSEAAAAVTGAVIPVYGHF
jgi:NAD(P)-dependent dehydrogenase (short-subunit alcohol dehydrogenase family)